MVPKREFLNLPSPLHQYLHDVISLRRTLAADDHAAQRARSGHFSVTEGWNLPN